ncbi:MAG: cobaltochelatase subunit CobN, partial [Acidobacteriota bacterium]|nr:cobaltochelatase subunit CobN [Acidobacteriota bacterium]
MSESNQTKETLRSSEARDRRVLELYERVVEIEERLIPTGLHVFGCVQERAANVDMLRMVASFDRPEAGARALPDLVAEGSGFGSYAQLLEAGKQS